MTFGKARKHRHLLAVCLAKGQAYVLNNFWCFNKTCIIWIACRTHHKSVFKTCVIFTVDRNRACQKKWHLAQLEYTSKSYMSGQLWACICNRVNCLTRHKRNTEHRTWKDNRQILLLASSFARQYKGHPPQVDQEWPLFYHLVTTGPHSCLWK